MEGFIVDREYKSSLKCLRIGDKIAELPIIQGGMGVGVSRSSLAGAVAAEGGVGLFLQHRLDTMRKALKKIRQPVIFAQSAGIF